MLTTFIFIVLYLTLLQSSLSKLGEHSQRRRWGRDRREKEMYPRPPSCSPLPAYMRHAFTDFPSYCSIPLFEHLALSLGTGRILYCTIFHKSKYKKAGVLPIRIVWSNVSSIGPLSPIRFRDPVVTL